MKSLVVDRWSSDYSLLGAAMDSENAGIALYVGHYGRRRLHDARAEGENVVVLVGVRLLGLQVGLALPGWSPKGRRGSSVMEASRRQWWSELGSLVDGKSEKREENAEGELKKRKIGFVKN